MKIETAAQGYFSERVEIHRKDVSEEMETVDGFTSEMEVAVACKRALHDVMKIAFPSDADEINRRLGILDNHTALAEGEEMVNRERRINNIVNILEN